MKRNLMKILACALCALLFCGCAAAEMIESDEAARAYAATLIRDPLIRTEDTGAEWQIECFDGEEVLYRCVVQSDDAFSIMTFIPTGEIYGYRDLERYPLEDQVDLDIGEPCRVLDECTLSQEEQTAIADALTVFIETWFPARSASNWVCMGMESREIEGENYTYAHFAFYDRENGRAEGDDVAFYAAVIPGEKPLLIFYNANFGAEGSVG